MNRLDYLAGAVETWPSEHMLLPKDETASLVQIARCAVALLKERPLHLSTCMCVECFLRGATQGFERLQNAEPLTT